MTTTIGKIARENKAKFSISRKGSTRRLHDINTEWHNVYKASLNGHIGLSQYRSEVHILPAMSSSSTITTTTAAVTTDTDRYRESTPLKAKLLASTTGAIMTASLMTPFDVLKTRMQTLSTPSPTTPKPSSTTHARFPISRPSTSSFTRTQHSIPFGRTSRPPGSSIHVPTPQAACNLSLYAPVQSQGTFALPSTHLDMPRTSTSVKPPRQTIISEIRLILLTQGPKGLYKGTLTACLQSVPSAGIYMIGYDYLARYLGVVTGGVGGGSGTGTGTGTGTVIPFTAGCLARVVSATIVSPLELFRTRLQARPLPNHPTPTYASTLSTLIHSARTTGPRTLWQGLGATLLRDVPFSGLYWMGFEGFKTRILDSRHRGANPELTLPETFLAGAGSAMGSAILTQPFDVLKTRRQVSVGPVSAMSSASSILSFSNTGSNIASTSTLSTLVRIVRTEGAKALFAGVGPRTLKVAPACGMMIGCYEGVGRLFKETKTADE